jgi:hypothetical protein
VIKRFQEFSFNVRAMKRLYKANLTPSNQEKRLDKSYVSNEYDVQIEGGEVNLANALFPGSANYRAEVYKTKTEEENETNDIEAIIDLLNEEYIFSHKRIKLNNWAFCKLFLSVFRCIEDIQCFPLLYFCGFCCCFYDCVACISKQCLWKWCCCWFRCCCKDFNKIPGYKLRRLYSRSVKRLHQDLDLKHIIQQNKALKVMYEQSVADKPLLRNFMMHADQFIIDVGSDENPNAIAGTSLGQNNEEVGLSKYYVPWNLDEGSFQMLRTLIRDRDVVRAERKDYRRYRQIDY